VKLNATPKKIFIAFNKKSQKRGFITKWNIAQKKAFATDLGAWNGCPEFYKNCLFNGLGHKNYLMPFYKHTLETGSKE